MSRIDAHERPTLTGGMPPELSEVMARHQIEVPADLEVGVMGCYAALERHLAVVRGAAVSHLEPASVFDLRATIRGMG